MASSDPCATYRLALPWYSTGKLSVSEKIALSRHIGGCVACRAELARWQAIAEVAQEEASQPELPFGTAWAQLQQRLPASQSIPASPQLRSRAGVALYHYWSLLRWQVRIIPPVAWLTTLLAMLLSTSFVLLSNYLDHNYDPRVTTMILVVTTLGASAISASMLYGSENDQGLEISLGTPTPSRWIVLSRLALVVCYNLMLALLSSILLALNGGGTVWGIVQLWMGPLLLFSSLSLLISLLASSAIVIPLILVVDFIQVVRIVPAGERLTLYLARPDFWQTGPLTVLPALLCLTLIALYLPHQTDKTLSIGK